MLDGLEHVLVAGSHGGPGLDVQRRGRHVDGGARLHADGAVRAPPASLLPPPQHGHQHVAPLGRGGGGRLACGRRAVEALRDAIRPPRVEAVERVEVRVGSVLAGDGGGRAAALGRLESTGQAVEQDVHPADRGEERCAGAEVLGRDLDVSGRQDREDDEREGAADVGERVGEHELRDDEGFGREITVGGPVVVVAGSDSESEDDEEGAVQQQGRGVDEGERVEIEDYAEFGVFAVYPTLRDGGCQPRPNCRRKGLRKEEANVPKHQPE